jgi:hypothetical protein
MSRSFGLAVFFLALCSALLPGNAQGSIVVPFGPQNDVPLATVTGAWGWTQIYRDDYAVDSVPVATMFAGLGTHIMIGGIRDGSLTIDVLAATTVADFFTHTSEDATHASNGSQWYFNGGSLGFAGLGDTINQNQADINGLGERDRLSWHTNGPGGFIGEYSSPATHVRFGWRSGNNTGLNGSTEWDKIVFTGNFDAGVVPEPISFLVWSMLGLVGLAALSRRADRTA